MIALLEVEHGKMEPVMVIIFAENLEIIQCAHSTHLLLSIFGRLLWHRCVLPHGTDASSVCWKHRCIEGNC